MVEFLLAGVCGRGETSGNPENQETIPHLVTLFHKLGLRSSRFHGLQNAGPSWLLSFQKLEPGRDIADLNASCRFSEQATGTRVRAGEGMKKWRKRELSHVGSDAVFRC